MLKLFKAILLDLNPPKMGDVYIGDPLYFILGRPVEHVLHGLTNISGASLWKPFPGNECYRLKIESVSSPYFICNAEALCTDGEVSNWRSRSQPRRIDKFKFKRMIVDGILKKQKL